MGRTERDVDLSLFEEILDIVIDIGYEIRLKEYHAAEKKIDLLGKLLQVFADRKHR